MHMSQMCVTARRKAGVTARSYTTRLVTEQSYHTHEKEYKFIIHGYLDDASFIFMVAPCEPCRLENLKHPNRVKNIIILP